MWKWFDADKEGLRQIAERLVERRGFGIIGAELYQNVMDTDATECVITLEKGRGRGSYHLTCEDNDPAGFPNLRDAYTVFAPSHKKSDPEKAGRFNIGEKFVLAFCREAWIETTKGTVVFGARGRTERPRSRRKVGTKFSAVIECNEERKREFLTHMQRILVRPGFTLRVNDVVIPERTPLAEFEETLVTEHGDDLRATKRRCTVEVYKLVEGETAMLYELGIPVVETGDKWHYSVGQKVPLNMDRDNVTPAYLRDLRTYVYNHLHRGVSSEDTEDRWVEEATSDPKVTDEALTYFKRRKFGDSAVAEDPFNRDANAAALTDGRTLITKHGLTKGQRENLKERGLLISSSEAYPTAGKGAYSDDPEAEPVEEIPESKWSKGMREIFEYTQGVARRLISKKIEVRFVNGRGCRWSACYCTGHLIGRPSFDYNVTVLGRRWFANGVTESTDDLILARE